MASSCTHPHTQTHTCAFSSCTFSSTHIYTRTRAQPPRAPSCTPTSACTDARAHAHTYARARCLFFYPRLSTLPFRFDFSSSFCLSFLFPFFLFPLFLRRACRHIFCPATSVILLFSSQSITMISALFFLNISPLMTTFRSSQATRARRSRKQCICWLDPCRTSPARDHEHCALYPPNPQDCSSPLPFTSAGCSSLWRLASKTHSVNFNIQFYHFIQVRKKAFALAIADADSVVARVREVE